MYAPVYTTTATSTGEGRAGGRAVTDDGFLDVTLAIPTSMGGPGGATNPEQLFAAGWASCFHSALKMVAAQRRAPVAASTVSAEVSVNQTDGGLSLSAVLWQLRADPDAQRPKASEWASAGVSIAVAIALGIASWMSVPGALAVWGLWAIVAGIPQLITAIRNRRSGGQVAQMLSGGISVFAGGGFLFQGLQGNGTMAGAAGYATLGAIFFLVSAIRLSVVLRKAQA